MVEVITLIKPRDRIGKKYQQTSSKKIFFFFWCFKACWLFLQLYHLLLPPRYVILLKSVMLD